jgi:glycosyltransferase involved in cell wall biosynthesis
LTVVGPIALVCPTFFGAESAIGGGERYVHQLALALAPLAPTQLVTFGASYRREMVAGSYERTVLQNWTRRASTPFSPALGEAVRGASVVHCFQYFSLSTFMAAWSARLQGASVFVTDLGGGGWTPGYQIDVSRWIDGHLPLSRYAARGLPGENRRFQILGGAVDTTIFTMRAQPEHDGSVVFLGRVLPHKGVHFLIRALPSGTRLHVIGPATDAAYRAELEILAAGKAVSFHQGLDDDAVVKLLQRAMALVHPTPVDDDGNARANELFGLALVEGMACGCPIIATRAASLPEIVIDGITGILVEPNEPGTIARAIGTLNEDPVRWHAMSRAARKRVEQEYVWSTVALRCLAAYEDLRP